MLRLMLEWADWGRPLLLEGLFAQGFYSLCQSDALWLNYLLGDTKIRLVPCLALSNIKVGANIWSNSPIGSRRKKTPILIQLTLKSFSIWILKRITKHISTVAKDEEMSIKHKMRKSKITKIISVSCHKRKDSFVEEKRFMRNRIAYDS